VDEEVLRSPCDIQPVEDFRRIWPFFRDRRIDTYQPTDPTLPRSVKIHSQDSACLPTSNRRRRPGCHGLRNKDACPKTYRDLQDKFGELAATLTRYQRVRINAPNHAMAIR